MNKLNSLLLIILLVVMPSSCKKEKAFNPPADAKVISFTKNANVTQRAIYQSESIVSFTAGETLHRYWTGIKTKPSHRLYVRLLSNSKDILFSVYFPAANKKIFSKSMNSKNITGCEIPEQFLIDDEFIIEVFSPQGVTPANSLDYRLFVGIQGKTPLEFYTPASGGVTK